MVMGHDVEAKALYLAHKGEVFKSDNQLWEQAIAEDFARLRKAGLTNPVMADSRRSWASRTDRRTTSGNFAIFAAIRRASPKKLVGHHCQWIAGTCY